MKAFWTLLLLSIFLSCTTKKAEPPIVSDQTLFELAQHTPGFSYYKGRPDTLPADPSSPHGSFVRVRFNPTARAAMNDSISQLTETTFPDESMIVKEVYDQRGGQLKAYAILYKLKNNANSSGGWLWSETDPVGNVLYSVEKKGEDCFSCHSSSTNIDFVKTFGLH